MPILYLILNNKRWTLIIILLLFSLWKTWQTNDYAGEIVKANLACKAKIENEVAKAVKPYKEAEEAAKDKAQKASEDYEQTKETERVKTETITRTVQKIVERPIYKSICFDDSGVSAINSLITENSS